MAATETSYALELRDLRKSFGGVKALRGVSMTVRAGEVVGLVGDNGAGKSTLVKCISGMHVPDEGEIRVDGVPHQIMTPVEARDAGIETVYQDLSLIDTFDVAENLYLNRELIRGDLLGKLARFIDKRTMYRESEAILARLRITLPSVKTPVGNLSGGQRQAVALGRAVAWGRHILLLDEPEAALGVEQSEFVLTLIERLRGEGLAQVYISHNMEHVLRVTDRVVVLRHGLKAAELVTADTTGQELVEWITGARTADARPLVERYHDEHVARETS